METDDEGRRAAVSSLELWSANHVEIVGLGAATQNRGQRMSVRDVDIDTRWMGYRGRGRKRGRVGMRKDEAAC